MALVAMLSLALYSAMATSLRARRTTSTAVEQARAASVAMDLVGRDFESVPPPTGILAGSFIGDVAAVEFYSIGRDAESDLPGAEGIRRVELYLDTQNNVTALMRRVTRNLLARTSEESEEEILCRNITSVGFRYHDGTGWVEEWDSTTMGDVLPMAVEVTLTMGDSVQNPDAAYQIWRVIPLACAKLADDTSSGGVP